jgi:transposase InsO family protein
LTHLVSDQGSHYINKTIEIFVEEFMISHPKSTIYYPQGSGQAKSTNKTLGKILAKLVNANQTDWDVMLVTVLWAY